MRFVFAGRHWCAVTVSALWENQSQVNQHLPAAMTNTQESPARCFRLSSEMRRPEAESSCQRLPPWIAHACVFPLKATLWAVWSRSCASISAVVSKVPSKCHMMDNYVPTKKKKNPHLEICQTDCFCLMGRWPPVRVWALIAIVPLNQGCLKSELLQISGALLNSFWMRIWLNHTLKGINGSHFQFHASFDLFLLLLSSVKYEEPALVWD